MCVNASERAGRGGLQGAREGDSPVSLWLVEGVSERCFRSASLTVENHINDGGFDEEESAAGAAGAADGGEQHHGEGRTRGAPRSAGDILPRAAARSRMYA